LDAKSVPVALTQVNRAMTCRLIKIKARIGAWCQD
jgi:hypothetical protein